VHSRLRDRIFAVFSPRVAAKPLTASCFSDEQTTLPTSCSRTDSSDVTDEEGPDVNRSISSANNWLKLVG
jgi:hypothetical protein